jgi:hypothetical protein
MGNVIGGAIGLPLLVEIATWTHDNCQPYPDGLVAQLLVLTRYSEPLITLFICAIGIQRQELYLFFFGVATLISMGLNWLLRVVVADRTHVVATCTDAYGDTQRWPSWQTQNGAFIVTFVATYPLLYAAGMPIYYAYFVFIFYFAVIAGDDMLNYHTHSQIIGAVLVGVSSGFVCQLIIRMLVPYFPWILAYPQINALGYVDTWCAPVLTLDEPAKPPEPLEEPLMTVLTGGKFNYELKKHDSDSGGTKDS